MAATTQGLIQIDIGTGDKAQITKEAAISFCKFDKNLALITGTKLQILQGENVVASQTYTCKPTHVTQVAPGILAVSFENGVTHLSSIKRGKVQVDLVLDHRVEKPTLGAVMLDNYLYTCVTGVGVFKWALWPNSEATLVKIMPVEAGLQLNSMQLCNEKLYVTTAGKQV